MKDKIKESWEDTSWILYDYASMCRRNRWQKGYNIKGIMGADRVYKKKAYNVVKNE
ncbi:MAG: hypothetical protein HFG55_07125 [Lachnospiraceae bacterium]|nr:hypothetical protein [Lachnospiraceae bacterium]